MAKTKAEPLKHECDNCGWKGTEDELACCLADMDDLLSRIDPGCPVPSGDCPECGACCYPIDENWRKHEAFPVLLAAFKAAVERMEAVAKSIPVHNRHKGVSQATHVAHMAGHLAQHAKIARKAIAKATGN